MPVSESDRLRGVLLALNRKLCEQSQLHGVHLDREEWSAPHRAEEVLAAAVVCFTSGYHDYPTFIAVNVERLENCLITLTLNIQGLQPYPTPEHI